MLYKISIPCDFIFAVKGIFRERWIEMFQGKFIFSQIMELVPWERFQTCVNRYKGDYYVKEFKCTDYFKGKRRFIHTRKRAERAFNCL